MATPPVGLPNRRQSLEGLDPDGRRIRLSWALTRQLYRCPGCGSSIDVGHEHIVVAFPGDDPPYYQHWHRTCALTLVRSMSSVQPIAAPNPPRSRDRGSRGVRRRWSG